MGIISLFLLAVGWFFVLPSAASATCTNGGFNYLSDEEYKFLKPIMGRYCGKLYREWNWRHRYKYPKEVLEELKRCDLMFSSGGEYVLNFGSQEKLSAQHLQLILPIANRCAKIFLFPPLEYADVDPDAYSYSLRGLDLEYCKKLFDFTPMYQFLVRGFSFIEILVGYDPRYAPDFRPLTMERPMEHDLAPLPKRIDDPSPRSRILSHLLSYKYEEHDTLYINRT